MTPKEKAEKLIYLFSSPRTYYIRKGNIKAKQFALIAVNELIDSHLRLTTTHDNEPSIRCKTYWQEVKNELEKS